MTTKTKWGLLTILAFLCWWYYTAFICIEILFQSNSISNVEWFDGATRVLLMFTIPVGSYGVLTIFEKWYKLCDNCTKL